ncbi:MAG TPA: alpha/beta fold hydrolase [Candidatus Udaeobacter sp.]|nr:alpha/beta fold hydrolase [Candidatus Udaeobacter sp.]
MKIYFDNPEFDGQFLRAVDYAPLGAQMGEAWAIAEQIKPGDTENWYKAWSGFADRLYSVAVTSRSAGHQVSARNAFLRTSNYHRASYIFMFALPVDPRVVEAYDKQTDAFQKAAALFDPPIEVLKIPYRDTTLPGYFIKPDRSDAPRKTLLCTGGYDGTCEELFFIIANGALERGYNVLTFDGPGQGGALVKQKMPMRPDWEKVVTPVVDYLCARPDVDSARIALYGGSFGGYLAPRAAAFEHRLAACIADAALFDPAALSKKMFPPEIANALTKNDVSVLEPFFKKLQEDTTQRFILGRGMWVHGAKTPWEYFEMFQAYSLADIAKNIQCPTFVDEAENDRRRGGGRDLYDALRCPREYVLFAANDGAGEHCEAGAREVFFQKMFDWLDPIIAH